MEKPARCLLQHEILPIARRLTAAMHHSTLTEPWKIQFHPVRPITTIASVDKIGALQQQPSTRHYRGLLDKTINVRKEITGILKQQFNTGAKHRVQFEGGMKTSKFAVFSIQHDFRVCQKII